MRHSPSTSAVEIYLDPATARAQKTQRLRRQNVIVIPALRMFGFALIAGILLVHNELVLGRVDWPQYRAFVAVIFLYTVTSWVVLYRFYRPFARIDLAYVFLISDIVFWALTVYVSGADRSWMYFVVLAHVLDQGATTVRLVRLFAHLGVLAYVAVLAWVHFVDGQEVAWGGAVAKTAALYTFGLYGSISAVPAEGLRRRLASAMRVARTSIADLGAQRQQLEEKSAQLEEAKRRAEEASQAKTEFLSRVSHEMRTPMNAILGFAQVLDTDTLTPQQHANVREILEAGEHLLALINDVLDLEDIEQNRITIETTTVRVADVVAEVLRLSAPLAASNSVTLRSRIDEPCAVSADRRRLKQILLNLVSNGVKYNRPGGTVTVRSDHVSATRVRISVHDTGIGVDRELLDDLFTPFHRLGASASSIEGTGLGLAVSRALATAMHGEIGVVSQPGRGSTFWLELPSGTALPIPASTAGEQATPSMVGVTRPGSLSEPPHVLCVEDNPSNARLVEILLGRRLGMRLTFATTGSRALELARTEPPDLILLDLNLPDGSGLAVLQALRADPRTHTTKVLIMSADALPEQIQTLLAAGADDYVTKPYDVNHFVRVVRDCLEPSA